MHLLSAFAPDHSVTAVLPSSRSVARRHRGVALLAIASIALAAFLGPATSRAEAPAELAQAPAPPSFQGGTVYGGGQIGKRSPARRIRFVSIRVSPERRVLRFFARFDAACPGLPRGALGRRIKEVPLAADGSFPAPSHT